MKICSKCGLTKTYEEFYVRDVETQRLHAQCKDCYKLQRVKTYKVHYQKYRELYLKRAKFQRQKNREYLHALILEFLKDKCCVICGENDRVVLEFDHLEPSRKSYGISYAIRMGYKWEKILIEISKCRILCANCHKRHTALQSNWYKI